MDFTKKNNSHFLHVIYMCSETKDGKTEARIRQTPAGVKQDGWRTVNKQETGNSHILFK